MDTIFLSMLLALALVINFSTGTASENPEITLRHGGKLRGLTAPFGTSMVDAFIGKTFFIQY